MSTGNTESSVGDNEAAAAILGMIETYGTPAAAGGRLFYVHITDRVEQGRGVNFWLSEYEFHGDLPGGVCVVRDIHGGKVYGELYLKKHYGDLLPSRAAALVKVCDKLLSIREDITRQIDALKAEIATLTASAEDAPAPAPAVEA
jgi:ABC-type phosphate transport system auxiliary subunit